MKIARREEDDGQNNQQRYSSNDDSDTGDDGACTSHAESCPPAPNEKSTQTKVITDDKSTQAKPPSDVIAHIDNVILRNSVKIKKSDEHLGSFSFETCKSDDAKFHFYTGMHVDSFMALWAFLGDVTNKVNYWRKRRKVDDNTPSKRSGPERKLNPQNQLFVTLIRLRRGFSTKDISYRFQVSQSFISNVIITWIQLLYHEFQCIKTLMFPRRQSMRENISPAFKKFKNIRVIVDCTEFHVHMPRNFEHQANLYSKYKHHHTYKVLVGLAPTGAICFMSEAFEGAKSDKEVFLESGIMEHLATGDMVMADRGFTIADELNAIGVHLNIPPFLMGREKLTPQEEIATKRIAKSRIHVERVIERLKKFRILKGVLPQYQGPVFSQIIYVIGCLVNFENPIC